MGKGGDLYEKDGNLWLILTEKKIWVFELTRDDVLWYNYEFFKDVFKYLSLDVVENSHYITEWVESVLEKEIELIRAGGVNHWHRFEGATKKNMRYYPNIKYTYVLWYRTQSSIDDAVDKGIKITSDLPKLT